LLSANGMAGTDPTAIDPSEVPAVTAETQNVNQTRAMAKMYDNAFTNLNSWRAGEVKGAIGDVLHAISGGAGAVAKIITGLNPEAQVGALVTAGVSEAAAQEFVKLNQWRAAQIATLGPMISRATAGRYNSDEAAKQADGMFPTIYDLGDQDVRDSKYNNTMAWIKSQEQTPTLDRHPGIKSPFPKYEAPMIKDNAIKGTSRSRNAKPEAPRKLIDEEMKNALD
jgi:hypothetical protein